MYNFKDPSGAARTAGMALAAYAVVDLLAAFTAYLIPPDMVEFGAADFMTLLSFLVELVTMILVGRWIYRTNANAHSFGGDMAITPGWAIGWFFVPFANLVKPYQGVRETWDVSHQFAGQIEEQDAPLLRWWWGLWLTTNIAATISTRIAMQNPGPVTALLAFDIFVSIANVALCVVLLQVIQRLSSAQLRAHQGSVFA